MSDARSQGEYETDLAWCHDAVQGVSRTFAITIDELEPPMADDICVGYLLCRIPDTIEDAGHIPPADQAALLRTYRAVLDPSDETVVGDFLDAVEPWLPEERTTDWEVVASARRIVGTFEDRPEAAREALREPVREMVAGMAAFVERYDASSGLRIGTVDELEEYCWYAAGTVGKLITDLLAPEADPDDAKVMRENAESFALLLQLVNVAKDVADDYREENNVYLPAEWLREEGVEPGDVTETDNEAAVARVVERVTERAAGYLDDTQAYLEVVPEVRGNRLSAWAIPFLLAVGTIRELRANPTQVLREGVKVSREEVYALITRFDDGVTREELGDLRRTIESGSLVD
jgi:farnesyl-diphosphate farnesyltransferase